MSKTVWTDPQTLVDNIDYILAQHVNELRIAVNNIETGDNIPSIQHSSLLGITATDHHSNANDPSTNQKEAMNNADAPTSTNPFVTESFADANYWRISGMQDNLDMEGYDILNVGNIDMLSDGDVSWFSGTTPVLGAKIYFDNGDLHFYDQNAGDITLSGLLTSITGEDLSSQIDGMTDVFTCSNSYAKVIMVLYNGVGAVDSFTETDPIAGTITLTFVPAVGQTLQIVYVKG